MKITDKEIVIINNYIEVLNKNKKVFFYDVIPGLIKDYSKKISKKISYGLDDFKECSSPSDRDIQDKISDVLDELLCDYFSDISNYIRRENQIISNHITRIDKNSYEFEQDRLIERLEYNEVPRNEEIKNLQNKLIDRINIHIAVRNQLNGNYYKVSREVENFVRENINSEYPKFVEELETIYLDIVNKFTQEKNDTLNDISKFKEITTVKEVDKIENEMTVKEDSIDKLSLDELKDIKEIISPEQKEELPPLPKIL